MRSLRRYRGEREVSEGCQFGRIMPALVRRHVGSDLPKCWEDKWVVCDALHTADVDIIDAALASFSATL